MPCKKRSQNGKQVSHRPDEAAQKPSPSAKSNQLFQFKITLLEITPLIWRRIQVPDCTLAVLHEVIQVAMGWENCHLHQFIIDGVRYGVPEPELKLKNEDKVLMSQIVPRRTRDFVSDTNTTSATAGCTRLSSRVIHPMSWGRIFRYASTDHEHVHRKMWAGHMAMTSFWRRLPIPSTNGTLSCSNGSVVNSTQRNMM